MLHDLLAVEVGQRHFGRRDEIEVSIVDPEQVLFEFGELPRALEGVGGDEQRGAHLEIAVLTGVKLEHELSEGSLEPRSKPGEHREPGAGHLGGSLEVQDSECLAQLPMRFGLEVEARRLAPLAHECVGGLVGSHRHRFVRQVR